MAAPEPLYRLLNIHREEKISGKTRHLLEATLISELITELKQYHSEKSQGDNYMLDMQFLRFIIRDIITDGEYTLEGIARYTGVHPDLIYDIAGGINSSPTLPLFHRLIELHRRACPMLYNQVRENIISRLSDNASGAKPEACVMSA